MDETHVRVISEFNKKRSIIVRMIRAPPLPLFPLPPFSRFLPRYNPDTTNAMKNMLSPVDGYFIEGELRTWPTL